MSKTFGVELKMVNTSFDGDSRFVQLNAYELNTRYLQVEYRDRKCILSIMDGIEVYEFNGTPDELGNTEFVNRVLPNVKKNKWFSLPHGIERKSLESEVYAFGMPDKITLQKDTKIKIENDGAVVYKDKSNKKVKIARSGWRPIKFKNKEAISNIYGIAYFSKV